jgi:hypothetical protein
MTEQMTQAGAFVLCTAIAVFWIAIAALVRAHAQRRRTRGQTPSYRAGLPQ